MPAVARAYNYPLHLRRIASSPKDALSHLVAADAKHASPFSLSGDRNIVLDTVKRGEDDHFSVKANEQTVILRLYEAYGGAGKVKVVSRLSEGKKVVKAEVVDVRHSLLPLLLSMIDDDAAADSSNAPAAARAPDQGPLALDLGRRSRQSARDRRRRPSSACVRGPHGATHACVSRFITVERSLLRPAPAPVPLVRRTRLSSSFVLSCKVASVFSSASPEAFVLERDSLAACACAHAREDPLVRNGPAAGVDGLAGEPGSAALLHHRVGLQPLCTFALLLYLASRSPHVRPD